MSLPTMTGVGRIIEDPELRFAASGTAVCKVRLAFNNRKKDEATGQWSDDKTFFIDGTAFKQLAENIAESFVRGTEVVVTGRLVTDTWDDRETGAKRSKPSLLIDGIGASVAFATAKVSKMSRGSGGGSSAPRGGGSEDPWASAAPASSGFGGQPASNFNDEPPF